MPSSGVRWTRNDRHVLQRLIRETPEKARQAVVAAAIQLTSDIQMSFGTSPSSAGDPPGVDTGNLRAGMGSGEIEPMTAIVYAQADYGPHLEQGTENMAARPFIAPMFEQWRQGDFRQFLVDYRILR